MWLPTLTAVGLLAGGFLLLAGLSGAAWSTAARRRGLCWCLAGLGAIVLLAMASGTRGDDRLPWASVLLLFAILVTVKPWGAITE